MPSGSLLPFMHDAARHVETIVGTPCSDLIKTVRAMASYDLAMLAYGYHPTLSMHSAAMTAAELLCIAEHLERQGAGPAREADSCADLYDVRELEQDAGVLGSLVRQLTQDDIARALAHFQQAVQHHGLDLVMSLALEMKNARTQRAMIDARGGEALH